MKTQINAVILLICAVFSTSCTTLNRYKSVEEPGANNTIADINLFGLSLSQVEGVSSSKTLWDLSADAQSQLIKILNSRYPDNGMFLTSLSSEYIKEQAQPDIKNFALRDLRLIFSVNKIRKYPDGESTTGIELSPADRLEYLRIILRIPENSALTFRNWNRYSTEYGSVDLADVSFNRTLQLSSSGSISVDKAKSGLDLSGEGASSISRKEDQSLRYRYLMLNGRMSGKKIEMEEEGTREIDLTGNISADVTLGFNTFPEIVTRITGLNDDMGKMNNPDKLKIDYSVIRVPEMRDIKDTIKADLELDFVYRNVIHGGKTYPEWDDRVKYYTGKVKKTIPLFTSKDYIPELYCIGIDNPDRELLKIKATDNYFYTLKFRSFEEASAFYTWLQKYMRTNVDETALIKIDGQMLVLKDNGLTYNQIKNDSRFKIISYF